MVKRISFSSEGYLGCRLPRRSAHFAKDGNVHRTNLLEKRKKPVKLSLREFFLRILLVSRIWAEGAEPICSPLCRRVSKLHFLLVRNHTFGISRAFPRIEFWQILEL
jgi:hypothetical protein